MNTKRIVLSAIIAMLPMCANADPVVSVGPATVPANGTAVVATDSAPYQTATIGEHDDEHIATTAYVKGAYNDAIAAVNKVNNTKQTKLYTSDGTEIPSVAVNPAVFSDEVIDYFDYGGELSNDTKRKLVTAQAVLEAMGAYLYKYMDVHPIEIYTTWDDDDTTEIYLRDE